ncbi:hypothetical protein EDC01DRAFT_791875 [Geopyxis carbonaria]|nr:hypothetical protein EDC01DRAFT_791875 [Geopyxis carbonaria]
MNFFSHLKRSFISPREAPGHTVAELFELLREAHQETFFARACLEDAKTALEKAAEDNLRLRDMRKALIEEVNRLKAIPWELQEDLMLAEEKIHKLEERERERKLAEALVPAIPPPAPQDRIQELALQLQLTTETLVEGTRVLAAEQHRRKVVQEHCRKLQKQNEELRTKCAELETVREALNAAVKLMKKEVEARDVVINKMRMKRVLATLGRRDGSGK